MNLTVPLVIKMLYEFVLLQIFISIVTSCTIERTHLDTYLLLSIYLSSVVFPIPLSWVWGGGWLAQKGVLDFAGAGIVHGLSGAIGLISAMIVGPRMGIFQEKLNLEQMGALYMQNGENVDLLNQYVDLIEKKQNVFLQGYKPPNFSTIKFQNTVDISERAKH